MKWLESIFQRLEGDEPEEWPVPQDLVFFWLAFGVPWLIGFLMIILIYTGMETVPVEVEKRILAVHPDGTYDYYIRLFYLTPQGRFPVSRVSTILYSDLEKSLPLKAIYHPLKPDLGFLKGLRGFWLPVMVLAAFMSLLAGGVVWLVRELLRKETA